jgi:DNA (cytosine-5)-methyltransferase 1
MKIGSLFSGIGGLDLGVERATGGRVVWQCENNPMCRQVLKKHWPDVPCYSDIVGLEPPPVDVLIGGFPCQDLSDASRGRGGGLAGEKSGLWYEMLRIIKLIQPGRVFIENVAGAAWKKWVPSVRADLWDIGYPTMPLLMSAAAVGAPFTGDRIFIAATHGESKSTRTFNAKVAGMSQAPRPVRKDWGEPTSTALGMADGVPRKMDRLRAVGNAVCPQQAEAAYRLTHT